MQCSQFNMNNQLISIVSVLCQTFQVSTVLGVLVVISYSTPMFLVVTIPIVVLYYIIQVLSGIFVLSLIMNVLRYTLRFLTFAVTTFKTFSFLIPKLFEKWHTGSLSTSALDWFFNYVYGDISETYFCMCLNNSITIKRIQLWTDVCLIFVYQHKVYYFISNSYFLTNISMNILIEVESMAHHFNSVSINACCW